MLQHSRYHANQGRLYSVCDRNAQCDRLCTKKTFCPALGRVSAVSTSIFLLVILSAVLHASWNLATKKVSGSLGTICIGLCAASFVSLPFAIYIILSEGLPLVSVPFIVATGIVHAFYFYFVGRSYEAGDISIVYPSSRGIGVAGTSLVAATILGESISVNGFTGIMLVCLGTVTLGLKRAQHGHSRTALLYALAVGLTIICYSCLDKVGVGLSNPVPYICGLFTIAAVLLTSFVAIHHRDDLIQSWKKKRGYGIAIGLGSIITYLLILFAFRQGPASYIVAAREIAVVIGSVLGFIFLRERLTLRKIVGITAITAGLVLIKIA